MLAVHCVAATVDIASTADAVIVPSTADALATADIPRTPEVAAIPEAATSGKAAMCRFAECWVLLIEIGYHQGSAFTCGIDVNSKIPNENVKTINVSIRPIYVMMVMIFPYGVVLVTVAPVSLPRNQLAVSLV